MDVECLIVDLDGVVRLWDPASMGDAESAYGLEPGTLARVAFDSRFLTPAITGGVSDAGWRSRVAAELSRRHGVDGQDVVASWSAVPGRVDSSVVALLREQRLVRRVALLSNATTRLRGDLADLGLIHEFDAIYNSSELGWAKPAPQAFEATLERLGVEPSRAAFVDDTPANVEAAVSLGLIAHHYTDVQRLAVFCEQLGVPSARRADGRSSSGGSTDTRSPYKAHPSSQEGTSRESRSNPWQP